MNIFKQRWRKLDNTAKIFSLSGNRNVFRYSAVLYKNVDEVKLKQAIEKTLNIYPAFKVKFKTGFFWNYLEYNSLSPIITKESEIPCKNIDFKENNDYLFKVTYFKNKINLDILHVLTDGAGGIVFFKALIYNYLDKNDYKINENIKNVIYEDEYLKNYNRKNNIKLVKNFPYILKGKANKNINNTYHYTISLNEIKNISKNKKVSITEYLTALYIYAIYLSLYDKKSKRDIIITIPIDLRKYYNVDTLLNFFVCMNVNPHISKNKKITFDKILKEVSLEFKSKINDNKIKGYLTKNVKLGKNIPIRLIPLFIKKIFIRLSNISSSTSTLSNVGVIDIENKFKKQIKNIYALVMPGSLQKIKCTVCSYCDNLNITINSNIDDKLFQKEFLKLLKSNLKKIKLESNC